MLANANYLLYYFASFRPNWGIYVLMAIEFGQLSGLIANVLSNVAFVPQIIKSYRSKKVDDLSIGMFIILFTTQLCWISYAIPIGAKNLWTSSLIEILLLLPIFAMWLRYKKRSA